MTPPPTTVDDGFEATSLAQCPHRPGSAEWKSWQQRFIQAQGALAGHWRDEHGKAWERLRQVGQQMRVSDESKRVDALIEEMGRVNEPESKPRGLFYTHNLHVGTVDLARYAAFSADPPVVYTWSPGGTISSGTITVNIGLDDMAMQRLKVAFRQVADAAQAAGAAVIAATPKPSRHAKGRKRRSPPGFAPPCHHGNPQNTCRDCSMHRR